MTVTDASSSTPPSAGRPEGVPDAPGHEPDTDLVDGPEPTRGLGLVLLVGGLVGAGAALTLLVEKLQLLVDPTYVPSCDVNPLLSCGSIMKTAQAEVLGFPNPVIGLLTFPVVAALGALALGRVRLPGWCWLALQGGAAAGLAFVAWLVTQSVAVIGALCPWCMLVWTVVIAIFWNVTAHNLRAGRLEAGPPGRVVAAHPGAAVAVTLLGVLAVLVASFPSLVGALLA